MAFICLCKYLVTFFTILEEDLSPSQPVAHDKIKVLYLQMMVVGHRASKQRERTGWQKIEPLLYVCPDPSINHHAWTF